MDIAPSNTGNHSSILVELVGKKEDLTFSFEGVEIEITGIRLGSKSGLAIHNIPMRSSSGTVFKSLNKEHFLKIFTELGCGAGPFYNSGEILPRMSKTRQQLRDMGRGSVPN